MHSKKLDTASTWPRSKKRQGVTQPLFTIHGLTPVFLYFDLGKVLLDFDITQMIRQVCDVSKISKERVREVLFDERLQAEFEVGQIDERAFYEAFCTATGSEPEFNALNFAASDIFTPKQDVIALVEHLHRAGYPLGILSNTCSSHWNHCLERFPFLGELFSIHVLSFRVGSAKPDAAIYEAAITKAGVRPEAIFFTDDLIANIEGASAAGIDAVPFTTAAQLAAELTSRSVRLDS